MAETKRDAPRRCYFELMVPAEKAIREAINAVEVMPADVRLTDAVVLLDQALTKVADFVDGIEPAPAPEPPATTSMPPIVGSF